MPGGGAQLRPAGGNRVMPVRLDGMDLPHEGIDNRAVLPECEHPVARAYFADRLDPPAGQQDRRVGKETSLVVDEDAGCEKNTPSVHDKVIRNRFSGDSADGEHGDAPKAVPLPEEEEVARLNPAGSPEDACTGGKRMGRRRNDRPPGERKLDRLSGLDPGRRDDPALPETALLDDDHGVPRG